METCLLLPENFVFLYSTISESNVCVGVINNTSFGICPLCQKASQKVHSYYERKVQDLPISGKTVKLYMRTRKFFCQQDSCSRKVFAERFGSCLRPWQRRLERSNEQIEAIGVSCGSKPGARICAVIGLPVSASTILRAIKRIVLPPVITPKVLGVDDFAFKKGHRYGTILVDLEKRVPIDLLPDREGKTLEDWLKSHPGVEIITRDRSTVYANAISAACPDAIQVADRWHLLKNLSENVERYLDTQRSLIRETAQQVNDQQVNQQQVSNQQLGVQKETGEKKPEPIDKSEIDKSEIENSVGSNNGVSNQVRVEKRYHTYEQVKLLQQQGYSRKAIARHLGLSRTTVIKYFQQEEFIPKTNLRRSNLLEYENYLRQRWTDGETCVKTLFEEIKALGYTGSYTILTTFLADYPRSPHVNVLPVVQKGATLSSRTLSIALCRKQEEWDQNQKPLLTQLLQKSDLLRQIRELSLEFTAMIIHKKGQELENWCQKASALTPFAGFVRGIRQDFAAVKQAMTSTWSNGQTEGQVNRLKNLKRQMYGRAGFELLRIRVLIRVR